MRSLPVSPGLDAAAGRLRALTSFRSVGFPYRAPTAPGGVDVEREASTLGIDYETDWARRYGVRLARAMVLDNVGVPLGRFVADPTITGTDRLAGLKAPVIFAPNHASHADTFLSNVFTLLAERRGKTAVVRPQALVEAKTA